MAALTFYRHGLSVSVPASLHAGGGPRSECSGWTIGATRRNRLFLYSVDERGLFGEGFALSLTVRDCPPTAAAWAALRKSFIEALERLGAIRVHWLTEWQRRGVPHLHAAIWMPPSDSSWIPAIVRAWVSRALDYRAARAAQHVAPIHDDIGWFQYLAKHAVRGLGHYQRSAMSMPAGWIGQTGRMWGHRGDWPVTPPAKLSCSTATFHRFRRLLRAWRIADARASGNGRRIRSARRMLQHRDRALCTVRGCSEWIPINSALDFCHLLAASGAALDQ